MFLLRYLLPQSVSPGIRSACLVVFATVFICEAQAEESAITPVPVAIDGEVDYARDVAPVLKQNCLACHNAKQREGGLSIETPADMLQGGESGEAILPGEPDASFLYLVASRQSEPVMPPLPNQMNAHKLTGEDVWKLKRWIELGAKGSAKTAPQTIHWQPMPAHLQPIYAIELSAQEDFCVFGRGNSLEVLELTAPYATVTLVDPQLKTAAHRDFVNAVAIHPTGDVIASAGFRRVNIWERSPATFTQLDLPATSTQFAESADGSWMAYAEGEKLTLFQPTSPGNSVTRTLAAPVSAFTLTPNELIVAGETGALLSWPLDHSKSTEGIRWREEGAAIRFLTTSGARVAMLEENGTVAIWDSATRKMTKQWNSGSDAVQLAISPDGGRLATLHKSHRVVIWDENGKQLQQFQHPAKLKQKELQLANELAVAKAIAADGKQRLDAAQKDAKTREEALTTAAKAVKEADEKRAAAVAARDAAKLKRDEATQSATAAPEDGNRKKQQESAQANLQKAEQTATTAIETFERATKTQQIEQNSLDKANELVAERTAAHDAANLRVTKISTAIESNNKRLAEEQLNVVAIELTTADRLTMLSHTGTISTWEITTGQPLRTTTIAECPPLHSARFASSRHATGITTDKKAVRLDLSRPWSLTKQLGPSANTGDVSTSPFADRVTSLSFSPDGELLATGGGIPSRSGELLVWDWNAAQVIHNVSETHSDVVLSLQFSPDGQKLLSGGADRFMRLSDPTTGQVEQTFEGHTDHVLAVAWSADGLTVASGSADTAVKIWDRQEGSQKRTISTAGKQVTSLRFVGRSDHVASSSGDAQVRLFEAGNGRHYRNFTSNQDFLNAIAVTDSETLMIAGGQKGVLRVWNAKTGQELTSLPPRVVAPDSQPKK